MAGRLFSITSGQIALSTSAIVALSIQAPTHQDVEVVKIIATGGQAAGGTDATVVGSITTNSSASGTGASGPASGFMDTRLSVAGYTIQSTLYGKYTSQPSSPTDLGYHFEFSSEGGIVLPFMAGELVIASGYQMNFTFQANAGTPNVTITVEARE